jgi:hypothetical protein
MSLRPVIIFFRDASRTFWFFSIIFLLIVLLSSCIPFFWDNITISEIASAYYKNGLTGFKLPSRLDYGVFTLYSYYLAVVWTIFGKSLLVSHIVFIPVVIGILYELKRISIRFIRPEFLFLLFIFILFDPAMLTQIILMGYDVFMMYFVLLAIRTLLERKYLWYSISLLLLSAISVRSVLFIFCLMIIQIMTLHYHHEKVRLKYIIPYIPALIFILFWFAWHYRNTDWIFFTPASNTFRDINNPEMILRHIGFIIWKLIDSGRIIIWFFCLIYGPIIIRSSKIKSEAKIFAAILLIPLIVYGCVMAFISNPIGHKYFLQTFVFLSILTVYFIQKIGSVRKQIIISALIVTCLLAGNFILYPQKYGNAWDTSLKVLPYFKAERDMKAFIQIQKISPSEVYCEFPMNKNNKFTYLQEDFCYNEFNANDIANYRYVIFSNSMNVTDITPYEEIQNKWKLVYKISSCQIFISLYKNPDIF